MADIKQSIIDYLEEELLINDKTASDNHDPLQQEDTEIKKMREIEAIKLRDRSHELKRHIAVIKRLAV